MEWVWNLDRGYVMGSRAYAFSISAVLLVTAACVARAEAPTPELYVAKVSGGAQVIPAGTLKIDGPQDCMWAATDSAGQFARRLRCRVSRLSHHQLEAAEHHQVHTVKLWIHAHECGHQFRGPDEETADCFAVQRGRRQGWLTPAGLDEVCQFMAPTKGDHLHSNGKQRCELMRKCYADKSVH